MWMEKKDQTLHVDGKKNRIKQDEMNPPRKASIRLLLFNPYPPRSPDAIAAPTGSHIEILQIRRRQGPKKQQIRQKKKLKIRTPQGRREERKQKKDADLTTVYVLVWESVGSRGKNRAKPSCCYGLGFEARLNRQWREGRASGRGSGDRRRTASHGRGEGQ